MNRLTIAADIIKQSVSALDVADALGWEVRHGRCKCPIHNGDGYNCVLYKGNRGFFCHTCKAGGDVIQLVRLVLFASNNYKEWYKHTLEWFDDTFHLGLDLDSPIDPVKQEQAKKALQTRKNAIEFQAWKEKMQFDLALTAGDIVRRLEDERDSKRPKTYGEWDEDFCAAVVTLPEARAFADECMMNCMKEVQN